MFEVKTIAENPDFADNIELVFTDNIFYPRFIEVLK